MYSYSLFYNKVPSLMKESFLEMKKQRLNSRYYAVSDLSLFVSKKPYVLSVLFILLVLVFFYFRFITSFINNLK